MKFCIVFFFYKCWYRWNFCINKYDKFIITVKIITISILIIIVNTKKEMIRIILKLITLIIIMDVIIMAISFVQLRMLVPEI